MTEHALIAAGDVPVLLPPAAWSFRVLDRESDVSADCLDKRGIGLLVVPEVGIAQPVVLLLDRDARLDAPPRCGIATRRYRSCLSPV